MALACPDLNHEVEAPGCADHPWEEALRVIVKDISVKGRFVRFSEAEGWALDAVTLACDGAVSSLEGVVQLSRDRSDATAHVKGAASVSVACDRCLKDVPTHVEVDEALTYKPTSSDARTGEIELSADELDVGWYEGGELHLDQVLSEAFALSMSPRTTCADDACKAVVESVTVDSDDTPGHPAFAALKDLF